VRILLLTFRKRQTNYCSVPCCVVSAIGSVIVAQSGDTVVHLYIHRTTLNRRIGRVLHTTRRKGINTN